MNPVRASEQPGAALAMLRDLDGLEAGGNSPDDADLPDSIDDLTR